MARLLCVLLSALLLAVAKQPTQPLLAQTVLRLPEAPATGEFLQHRVTSELGLRDRIMTYLPKNPGQTCFNLFLVVCFFCCCGEVVKNVVGEQSAQVLGLLVNCVVFWYLIFSGIYSAWWHGSADVGFFGKIMCLWVVSMFCCFGCLLCMGGGALVVKNQAVREMKDKYEQRLEELSAPRRAYYSSAIFEEKCDRIFAESDSDKNGELDMQELQHSIEELVRTKNQDRMKHAETEEEKKYIEDTATMLAQMLKWAFEDHAYSRVNKHEFTEMMKYISVMQLENGKVTTEEAFEILQLDQKTAKLEDVSRAYRKMAMQFHPDKRRDVSSEIAHKDQQEINDAKTHLEAYFRNLEDKSGA